MGYEPASDEDMKIFNINQEGIHVFEESNLPIVKALQSSNKI